MPFSKEEKLMFDNQIEGFEDALVASKLVRKFSMGEQTAERSSDTIWRPVPSIARTFTGLDQTGNFAEQTRLSVPATVGGVISSPFQMDAINLRDPDQAPDLVVAAREALASDINILVNNTVANEGTVVVTRTAAASGYDDVAEIDSTLNELGVPKSGRKLLLGSRAYNGMASNLAARQTMNDKVDKAYSDSFVGKVSSFDTFKMDYAPQLAAFTATTVTMSAANQYYTPLATQPSSNGINETNVDNRTQTISIAVGGNTVAVGDCFTIAGVNSTHHITHEDTGQLKTFRVRELVTGAGGTGTIKISPPIISGQGATTAELQYQNVTATPANGAAITFLNIAAATANPFWVKDAVELLPSKLMWPSNSGLDVLTSTTDSGITVTMAKAASVQTGKVDYRLDVMVGAVMLNPEQAGIELFSQT